MTQLVTRQEPVVTEREWMIEIPRHDDVWTVIEDLYESNAITVEDEEWTDEGVELSGRIHEHVHTRVHDIAPSDARVHADTQYVRA
jgi:hypothetical protein